MLSFQKLDVYQRSVDFLALAVEVRHGRTRLLADPRSSARAVLDALLVVNVVDTQTHLRGSALLQRIVAMLTKLCR